MRRTLHELNVGHWKWAHNFYVAHVFSLTDFVKFQGDHFKCRIRSNDHSSESINHSWLKLHAKKVTTPSIVLIHKDSKRRPKEVYEVKILKRLTIPGSVSPIQMCFDMLMICELLALYSQLKENQRTVPTFHRLLFENRSHRLLGLIYKDHFTIFSIFLYLQQRNAVCFLKTKNETLSKLSPTTSGEDSFTQLSLGRRYSGQLAHDFVEVSQTD